jgi:hypothetical protein
MSTESHSFSSPNKHSSYISSGVNTDSFDDDEDSNCFVADERNYVFEEQVWPKERKSKKLINLRVSELQSTQPSL